MKFVRFSTLLAIAGLFLLTLTTSCRHGSPTGPSDTTTVHDTGSCCHGRIILSMTDSVTGHLLDGGSASLYGNDQLISTKSMSTTGTVWDGLCPGHYHIVVSKDGYHSQTFVLDSLGCNGTETPHHVLSPIRTTNAGDSCCHGILEIAVHDSTNGESVTGATVTLTNRTTGAIYTRTTSAGLVRFDGLCPGNYLCQITDVHFTTSTFDFEMTCNDSLSFNKTIALVSTNSECDSASITVHVRDSVHQDSNISGATVTIRMDGHSDNFESGTTTDGGYYTASHLPGHTTYIVTISKDGYHTKSFVVQVGDCQPYFDLVYLSPQ